MIKQYRDEYIYLFLISIMAFLGAYFSALSLPLALMTHVLLLINSFIVYFLAMSFSKKKKISFLLSILYLFSPTHANNFIFLHLEQALLAESALLVCTLFYYLKRPNLSFIFLALAIFFNIKLILLYPFFFYFNKTNKWEKAFAFSQTLMTFIYAIPLFMKNPGDFLFKTDTVFYIFEMLFLPIKRSLIDFSLIVPDFHTRVTLIAFGVLAFSIAFYYLRKSNPLGKAIAVFIFTALLSTFIPFREWIPTGDYSFYFNAAFYPMVLLGVLGIFMLLGIHREKMTLIFLSYLCISWAISNAIFQKKALDVVNNWGETIFSLPDSFNKEEEIKMQYVRVLTEHNEVLKAEILVNETRMKFPKEVWYDLALDFAKRRNDQEAIIRIRQDLIRYQVPFQVD